jgi:hypothetical protein
MSLITKRLLVAVSLLALTALVVTFCAQQFNHGVTHLASAIWGS